MAGTRPSRSERNGSDQNEPDWIQTGPDRIGPQLNRTKTGQDRVGSDRVGSGRIGPNNYVRLDLYDFSSDLFPLASEYFTPLVFVSSSLCLFGAVSTSRTATWYTPDIFETLHSLRVVYTSAAHMGLSMIGLFTGTVIGVEAEAEAEAELDRTGIRP